MPSYYSQHAKNLKHELMTYLKKEEVRKLHRIQPWRHFAIVIRQFLILTACTAGLAYFKNPLIWIPLAFAQGFTIFNFTVLLHEVVHNAVFIPGKKSRILNKIFGLVYAFPSGISASQFTRWHLDHHAELGSATEDPKRFYLSPKKNKRWVKLLYFTPALFFIYFRAAERETATYPDNVEQRIRRERMYTILFQLFLMGLSYLLGGTLVMLRVYVVPVFLIFPIAFALNRMGQHYNVNPADPAQWSTLVKSSRFWNFWFLYSNFHLEHHYFPGVPFYNLPKVHVLLQPFFHDRGMRAYSYRQLFYQYVILNRAPHTMWEPVTTERTEPTEALIKIS